MKIINSFFFLILFPYFSFSQKSLNDSLQSILNSSNLKKMTYEELMTIQANYQKIDKNIRIAFSKELLSRKDLLSNDNQKAMAYLTVAENLRYFGDDIPQSKTLYEESIKLFSKTNNLSKKAEALAKLGVYYQNIDEDSVAIKLYTESLQLAEKIKDPARILPPYRGFVFLFTKMGLYDKAISYGLEGIRRSEQFNDQISVAFISNNLGNAFLQKGDYQQAVLYYKKALSINKDAENIIRNSSNIGNAYLFLNKTDSATKYLDLAESLLPKVEIPRVNIFAFSYLAKLRNVQNRHKEAVFYGQNAIKYANKFQLESIADVAYESLVISYKKLNKPDSALWALENYWKIKQRFLEKSRNKTVAEVEQQFQQYKKENEIAILKKDQEIGNTEKNAAIIVALLLALLAGLFYNRFRLKKGVSETLEAKNIEIEKQKELIQISLAEKETLLREIHHRVKNNLQIISSLLNFQSESIEDTSVLSSIKDGQTRIQAMSLIHQNLYQSENINQVNIENYIKELVGYLASMYSGNAKNVAVKVMANNIFYEIETAIPLGLIVNELVSNAFKYAFDKEKGEIFIEIQNKKSGENLLLVKDNGKGLSHDFNLEKNTSLGLKLVKILSKQLRGKVNYRNENGAVFEVTFKPQTIQK
jgi:two-component system, sensor histidine kinase PdtaS